MDATLVYDQERTFGCHRVEVLSDALIQRGFSTSLTPAGEPIRAGVLVVDSVATRADDLTLYRADRVVAIDDFDRDLSVDLVVDPNAGAKPELHRHSRCIAVGRKYSLVDLSFLEYDLEVLREDVKSIEVMVEPHKKHNASEQIVAALQESASDAEVKQLTGKEDAVEALGRIAAADIVVASPFNSLLYEALALGRPTVVVSNGKTDQRVTIGLAEDAAVAVDQNETVVDAVKNLAKDFKLRRELTLASRSWFDGLGALRVADEIVRLVNSAA